MQNPPLKNFKEKKKPVTPTLLWADFETEQKKQKSRHSLNINKFILCSLADDKLVMSYVQKLILLKKIKLIYIYP